MDNVLVPHVLRLPGTTMYPITSWRESCSKPLDQPIETWVFVGFRIIYVLYCFIIPSYPQIIPWILPTKRLFWLARKLFFNQPMVHGNEWYGMYINVPNVAQAVPWFRNGFAKGCPGRASTPQRRREGPEILLDLSIYPPVNSCKLTWMWNITIFHRVYLSN